MKWILIAFMMLSSWPAKAALMYLEPTPRFVWGYSVTFYDFGLHYPVTIKSFEITPTVDSRLNYNAYWLGPRPADLFEASQTYLIAPNQQVSGKYGYYYIKFGMVADTQKGVLNVPFYISNVVLDIDEAPAAVPEPGIWLTMIVGFGLIGHALRRRRTAQPLSLPASC